MFAPLMEGRRAIRLAAGAACAAAALGAAGCGDDASGRQDAGERERDYRVDVVRATFPARQAIAARASLRITVRNAGEETAPNVAVTVRTQARQPGGAPTAFGQAVEDPRFADATRPVWIVDESPSGGGTAGGSTWALGPLEPGRSRTFAWSLTPVQPGRYAVAYEVAPGLGGRARLAAGSKWQGSFRVRVGDTPPDSRVGEDGSVVRTQPPDDGR
jgi:hypothetical protein